MAYFRDITAHYTGQRAQNIFNTDLCQAENGYNFGKKWISIANDALRDLFKPGKYPDVNLPMCVLRRVDAVLEPTKAAVLDTRKMLDEARITEQRAALCATSGQAFYNTSRFTLRGFPS